MEDAIDGAVFYLDKQEDPITGEVIEVPDVYIHFGSILGTRVVPGVQPVQGTAKQAIFAFLRSELRNNVEILPLTGGTTQQRIATVAEQLKDALTSLRDPQFPPQIPSLTAVPDEFRELVYNAAVALLRSAGAPPLVLERLAEADAEIKVQLLRPDADEALIEALSVAMEAMVEPLIDASFVGFRDKQLDEEDRFDPNCPAGSEPGQDQSGGAGRAGPGAGLAGPSQNPGILGSPHSDCGGEYLIGGHSPAQNRFIHRLAGSNTAFFGGGVPRSRSAS